MNSMKDLFSQNSQLYKQARPGYPHSIIQEILKQNGFLVGAIRQPTVKVAIIRLIAKIDIQSDVLTNICKLLKELNVNK